MYGGFVTLANSDQCWTGQWKKGNIFTAMANVDLSQTGNIDNRRLDPPQ